MTVPVDRQLTDWPSLSSLTESQVSSAPLPKDPLCIVVPSLSPVYRRRRVRDRRRRLVADRSRCRLPPAPQAPTVDVTSDTSSVEYQDAAEAFDDADDVLFVQEDRPKRVPLGECRIQDALCFGLQSVDRLHELHESLFPFVSRIEFTRSKLSNLSAHVSFVTDCAVVRRPCSS